MYERKSRLSSRQQSKLIEHFVAGATARAASEIIGLQANTAIKFYLHLRQLIASKLPSYELSGEVEADESYWGVRKGKRGRGAAGKVAVFGLLKPLCEFNHPSAGRFTFETDQLVIPDFIDTLSFI